MARGILLFCLSIISVPAVLSQSQSPAAFQDFDSYYNVIRNFGEPTEGSLAEREIQEYLASKSQSLGFTVQRYNVQSQGKFHSFSRSIRITLPGKRPGTIGIQLPMSAPDAVPDGGYDSWNGAALIALLIDRLASNDRPFSIQVDLLGAETALEPGLGTRRALEDPTTLNRMFAIYLSVFASGENWELANGAGGKISPLWLTKSATENLRKNSLHVATSQVETQLHRIGLGPKNQIGPYLTQTLPTIELRPVAGKATKLSSETAGRITAWLVDMLVDSPPVVLSETDSPQWDANYLVFPGVENDWFVPELFLVVGLLAGMTMTILMMALRRRAFLRYLFLLGRRLPAFIILTLFSIAITVATTLLIRLVTGNSLEAFVRPESALVLVAIKFALSAFLFHSLFQIVRRYLPKEAAFYSAAAMAWSLIALIAVMSINMTIGLYSAIALWGIGLGVMAKSPWLKMLCGTAGLSALLWPVIEALRLFPSPELVSMLATSLVPGDLLIGVLSLPFALSLRRIIIMIPGRYKPRNKLNWLLVGSLVVLALGALVVLGFVFHEKRSDVPDIALQLNGSPDSDRSELTLSGVDRTRVKELRFISRTSQGSEREPQNEITTALGFGPGAAGQTDETSSIDLPYKRVMLSYGTRTFLGRKTLVVTVNSPSSVDSVDVSFLADSPLLVHSTNFPYTYEDAGTIRLLIGKNPPLPLRVELTLPMEAGGQIVVETRSTEKSVVRLDDDRTFEADIPYLMKTYFRWD